jgi:dephospho-CoA kinase
MSEHNNDIKIIAFVGLSGSGKSVAVDYLTEKGYPKVYFGGVLYQAMAEEGIEQTPENDNIYRVEMRKREGNDFIVKRIVKQLHDLIDSGQHRLVADGLYSWTEYKILKHEFPGELTVVAVVSPKHLRHNRLSIRPERPLTSAQANERDYHEIEDIEKGGPIAIADYYIHNDGDLDHLHKQMNDVLDHVEFYQN